MAVIGWLAFGPRRLTTARTPRARPLLPALYLVFTLVRGPMASFYPSPFLDVATHGHGTVLLDSLAVAALLPTLAFGALAIDRALGPGRRLS